MVTVEVVVEVVVALGEVEVEVALEEVDEEVSYGPSLRSHVFYMLSLSAHMGGYHGANVALLRSVISPNCSTGSDLSTFPSLAYACYEAHKELRLALNSKYVG